MTNEQYDRCLREKLCMCGSMLPKEPQYDARGIFLCYTCNKCYRMKMSGYRVEVLTDSNYWHDEPIDD